MRIRCERCATVYELDESRLPAHGALVKCTRCDHVFRAAPPAGAQAGTAAAGGGAPEAPPGADRQPPEERTALFGFSAPPAEEGTASIATAPAPAPLPERRQEGHPAARRPAVATGGRGAAPPGGARWVWVVLAALLAAAILAGGVYLAQRRAATPTTRLPAGAELFPT